MGQLISVRSYARYRAARGWVGTTHQAVRKRIERGLLDGAWKPMLRLLDCQVADSLWPNEDVSPAPPRPGNGHDTTASSPRAAAELRIALAKAEAAELELRRRRGELVEVADVRSSVLTFSRLCRDRWLALPNRMGPEVAGMDPKQAADVLRAEVDAILDEMIAKAEALGREPATRAAADEERRP